MEGPFEKQRIRLGEHFHAEPGKTPGHLHDVYTTEGLQKGERNWVGELSVMAVEAWRAAVARAEMDL